MGDGRLLEDVSAARDGRCRCANRFHGDRTELVVGLCLRENLRHQMFGKWLLMALALAFDLCLKRHGR